jgi:hypothetical protein
MGLDMGAAHLTAGAAMSLVRDGPVRLSRRPNASVRDGGPPDLPLSPTIQARGRAGSLGGMCARVSGSAVLALLLAVPVAVPVAFTVPAAAQAPAPPRAPDVMYVPTPQEVVDAMLRLAAVTATDVVYDLGSGDGRIPITAAQAFGATGVGVELDPALIKEASGNAALAGVGDKVTFLNQDLFETDLRPATVITLYLLREMNLKLMPRLKTLKPGTRIVAHSFGMGSEWPADRIEQVSGKSIFLWIVK